MNVVKYLIFSLLFIFSGFVMAVEQNPLNTTFSKSADARVLAAGEAEIAFGDIAAARHRALRRAIENASLQVNARIQSTQVLENGALVIDHLRINSAARVQDLKVIDEYQRDDVYIVEIMAWVSPDQVCATGLSNAFRKSVAVTGFPMLNPEQSTMGHLGAVDRSFASHLVNSLNGLEGIQAMDANYMMLYPTVVNAPTSLNSDKMLTKAVTAARQLGAQFVVSGVIRDLAMSDPDQQFSKVWKLALNQVGLESNRGSRNFVFDMYVHDGYSGALVFQSRYSAEGIWNVKRHKKVAFGSAAFWATDYGKQVQKLVAQSIVDLQSTIQCQPFMASISRVDDFRIYVDSGSSSGLRPGDKMAVYRTLEKFDRNQNEFTQIADTKLMAVIKQVQPNFAIAEIPVRVEQLNLQSDDLVIAW